MPVAGPPMNLVAMMPTKNTTAIDASVSAVLRFDARRRAAAVRVRHGVVGHGSARRRCRAGGHLTAGGVSNVWYGTGDGSVHSSVSAPSHGRAGAFSPLPRAHCTIE